jgi:hypothetical protein
MKDILLKIELVLVFVDAKVWLLVWFIMNLYRNTELIGSINGHQSVPVANAMGFVWDNVGSPYIVWIPIVAIADVLIKNTIRKMI